MEYCVSLFGVHRVLLSTVKDTLKVAWSFSGKKVEKDMASSPFCLFWTVWKKIEEPLRTRNDQFKD